MFGEYISLKCSKAYSPKRIVVDPVVGPKVEPESYARCSYARVDRDLCGPTGSWWQPKHKSGLFKLIKKEAV